MGVDQAHFDKAFSRELEAAKEAGVSTPPSGTATLRKARAPQRSDRAIRVHAMPWPGAHPTRCHESEGHAFTRAEEPLSNFLIMCGPHRAAIKAAHDETSPSKSQQTRLSRPSFPKIPITPTPPTTYSGEILGIVIMLHP